MKATIRDANVKVYSNMDVNGLSIATLQQGNVIEIGSKKRSGGKFWTPVVLATGQQAYIPGETNIFVVRDGSLMQNNVEVHSEPSSGSLIKQKLDRNTMITILDVVTDQGQQWVKIKDGVGNEGFIPGETRVRVKPVRSKATARKNMISGGMWLVAGLVWVLSERSAPAGSGLILFGYFALLFGVAMLISGAIQLIKAPA